MEFFFDSIKFRVCNMCLLKARRKDLDNLSDCLVMGLGLSAHRNIDFTLNFSQNQHSPAPIVRLHIVIRVYIELSIKQQSLFCALLNKQKT